MKDQILEEIRRLAARNGGQPPGEKLFVKETGIAQHQWRGVFWARWGDALVEAGFSPNEWNKRHDSDEVLAGFIKACRHFGRLPVQDELRLLIKADSAVPHPVVVRRHFGKRPELVAALAAFAAENAGFDDIVAMLPPIPDEPAQTGRAAALPEGWVYLFKSGGFYKIGRSDDLERRIKEVGIKLPEKLTPVHSIRTDDPPGIEAYWHRRFADKRANGEWFKLTAQDVAAFKRRKFQ